METVIETHGLTRSFREVEAVRELDLAVTSGKAFALLGRNGAGKTTTIKLVAGLLRPTRGESRVLGTLSTALGPGDWQRLGYVSENQSLYEWLTAGELLAFARPFYPTWDRDLESMLVRKLSVPLERKVSRCSRGEKMKLALVLALAFRPKLLVLDEPFAGLDPLAREDLLAGMMEVTGQESWSVFFSTHDVDEVERLADEVGFIEEGRLQLHEPLEVLQGRFRRVHVSMPAPLAEMAAGFAEPAAIALSAEGGVLRFVHTQFTSQVEAELRRRFSGGQVEIGTLSLREVFLALARASQERSLGHA
jgi:ABC-2 type transport system ATP-binding protein